MLFKNKKGIVHALNPNDPQVIKWIKDDQVVALTEKEVAVYRGKKNPAKKAAPKAEENPAKKSGNPELEELREKYLATFAENPNPRWNSAFLKKKLNEAA